MKKKHKLSKTTCYVANIMPILHDGKIITIIRKGENVIAKCDGKNIELNEMSVLDNEEITTNINRLIVRSYHEDELTSMNFPDRESGIDKRSVLFVGKTYMPGEREAIRSHIEEAYLADTPLSHLHQIAGKEYCFLICGEFLDGKSTVAAELAELPNRSLDFIVHCTNGGDLHPTLMPKGKVYIHSDMGSDSKVMVCDEDGRIRRVDKPKDMKEMVARGAAAQERSGEAAHAGNGVCSVYDEMPSHLAKAVQLPS